MQREQGLKAHAEAAFRAALAAADPGPAVARWLDEHPRAARPTGKLAVVALGKAACQMVAGALARRPADPDDVLVVTKDGHGGHCPPEVGEVRESGHPHPDQRSLDAGEALLNRAGALGPEDELLLLISGGASALADALPSDLPAEDWMGAQTALVGAGLPIHSMNALRKHISRLKGGQLARAAAPTPVTALLLSDVVGDDPAVIGSGPAAPDPTTFQEARAIAGAVPDLPASVSGLLGRGRQGGIAETPKPGELPNATNAVVANNRVALEAAAAVLSDRGYAPLILTSRLQGEAREVARAVAAVGLEAAATGSPAPPPVALLWGGETTVTLGSEPGEGGRNQELALAMAADLEDVEGVGALCAGTDGTDGPTDAAGAWVDGATRPRALGAGRDPRDVLAAHDSGSLFRHLDDRLVTGPTGTNVMDLVVMLAEGDRRRV